MIRIIVAIVICIFLLQISDQTPERNSSEYVIIDSDTIPQGKMAFELYFAEWGGRIGNVPCEVIIEGKNIIVQQTSETNLSGEMVLAKGILMCNEFAKLLRSPLKH